MLGIRTRAMSYHSSVCLSWSESYKSVLNWANITNYIRNDAMMIDWLIRGLADDDDSITT